jgi:hypothetical protein
MPKAKAYCVRRPHEGSNSHHVSAENMEARRVYRRAHPSTQKPDAKKKSARKTRITAYGITVEQFTRLLENQGCACAMCFEPFGSEQLDGEQPIHIDHDHGCCSTKNRSCGRCVRGLALPRVQRLPRPHRAQARTGPGVPGQPAGAGPPRRLESRRAPLPDSGGEEGSSLLYGQNA